MKVRTDTKSVDCLSLWVGTVGMSDEGISLGDLDLLDECALVLRLLARERDELVSTLQSTQTKGKTQDV